MLILLWGLPTERPLAAVADALRAAGETPVLVDQRRASAMRASLAVDNAVSGQLAIGARSYDLAAVTAAYVRPYDTYVLNPPRADGSPKRGLRRAMAIDETLAAWCDVTPALVLNRPAAMASNSSKPYQLQLIRTAGFAVPETLVTTDREAVEAFRETHGELIYKSVSSIRSRVSRLTDEHCARLNDLTACPTQFQQFIPGQDHRVHVVGGAVFASALRCEADDYRYPDGQPLEVSAVTLPDDVAERCVRLAGALGLPLAGIDLRRTPNGTWYCFEVNPSPAFTYYSARTGQPIAEAIAALLLHPSGASEAHFRAAGEGRGGGVWIDTDATDLASPPSPALPRFSGRGGTPAGKMSAMLDTVSDTRMVFLDELTPLQAHVGYGQLGTRGSLGYEGKRVVVQNRSHAHALSAHPPARVLYHLNGRYTTFSADVAINDDAGRTNTHADFTVLVDGVRASEVRHLRAGEAPRRLAADVRGAQCLELVVATSHWNHCHAVWLEPRLEMTLEIPRPSSIQDCLGRAEIALPAVMPRATRCIATLVSSGYEELADDMLGSLFGNGDCQDALLVMFVLGRSAETLQLAAKYGALVVPCQARAAVNPMSKAVLYSIARVVDADYYLCLDSDMLVLGSIRPVFAALEACPDSTILAVREANGTTFQTVGDAFLQVYGGNQAELSRFASDAEAAYPLVVNDGIFAGSKAAMCALDETIRGLAWAAEWMDERRDIWWRNQFVFNLALAKLHCGVELDGQYNVQLHAQDVSIGAAPNGVAAQWRGRPVRVLHLSGAGKRKYPEWRGVYANVRDPLTARAGRDHYQDFVTALRGWIGRFGMRALAWSFYGTGDARNGRVGDGGGFPLFATLHYLLRSNGCVRVLETGTARGVSAACIASAIASRDGASLVTFDPYLQAEALDLWAALPLTMRGAIEPRAVDSIAGMRRALELGERFDAALLDSVHSAEHVWAEFQLAARLVSPGGLILIHDAVYAGGTVPAALRRIEDAGFGVTRLWTAETGVPEDDGLGLAVIENRSRTGPDPFGDGAG